MQHFMSVKCCKSVQIQYEKPFFYSSESADSRLFRKKNYSRSFVI